jgi:hypothetical protein
VPCAIRSTRNSPSAKIGDPDDGGIYAGLSAEDGKPLHTACADLPKYKTYDAALAAAEKLKARHPTAHVPTLKELNQNLFNNRNIGGFKDTFNTSGSDPGSVYRSSELFNNSISRAVWFGDGYQGYYLSRQRLPVRLVW